MVLKQEKNKLGSIFTSSPYKVTEWKGNSVQVKILIVYRKDRLLTERDIRQYWNKNKEPEYGQDECNKMLCGNREQDTEDWVLDTTIEQHDTSVILPHESVTSQKSVVEMDARIRPKRTIKAPRYFKN